jgi:CBS domain-containing protein
MELTQIARKVVSTHPGATTLEAAELMAVDGAAAIVVLDGDHLVGILSARDIVERVVARQLDPATTLVSAVMTPKVRTVPEGTSIRDTLDRMLGQCRHLPLVDVDGHVTGMLTMGHLLGERVGELSLQNADLVGFISTDGPGG